MEYIQGQTLAQLIPPAGMRADQALKFAAQVAGALAVAHSAGIIHRDLKPANVMVTDDAAREAEGAIELEPLIPINYGGPSLAALWRRQWDLALAVARRVLELKPDFGLGHCLVVQVLCQEGGYQEAAARMQRACNLLASAGFWGPGLLGYCYARSGRKNEARRVLSDLETMREHSYAQATALAAVHAGLGEKDRALEWLERAFEEHCGGLVWVRHDPVWDGLREEPRFQALLSKMNLVD